MFILGLTGSVGMGKSTTARLFAEEGVPVHDADAVVHRLYEGEAVPAIEAAFPGTTADGKVDRAKLGRARARRRRGAEAARSDRASAGAGSRAAASWPRPRRTARRSRCSTFRCCSRPAASGSMRWWWCRRRAEVQRARVLERPGMTAEKLEAMLAKQMPDAEKRRRADFVVDTSQGFEAARAQVRAILAAVATMPEANRQ